VRLRRQLRIMPGQSVLESGAMKFEVVSHTVSIVSARAVSRGGWVVTITALSV
jgi:hypothetical protein